MLYYSNKKECLDIRVREYDDFVVVGRYIGSVINEERY